MSDEPKKKPLSEAIQEALGDISPDAERACEELEVEIKQIATAPVRRRLRVRLVFLPSAHSYGEWKDGITLLDFPAEELHGVLTGEHYYEPKTGTSYYRRRTSTGGTLYKPSMKALKRILQ